MALYGVTNFSATTPALGSVATTHKTFLQLAAAGTKRAFIYEWKVGPAAIPNAATDCEIIWTVIKQTTAGTGSTAMTSSALDQADAAAVAVAIAGTITAEPTGPETGVVDGIGANQRASYRWVVAPGGPGELVTPITSLAGFGIRAKSTNYSSNVLVGFLYRE